MKKLLRRTRVILRSRRAFRGFLIAAIILSFATSIWYDPGLHSIVVAGPIWFGGQLVLNTIVAYALFAIARKLLK